jgi:hypothetical protein
MDARCDATTFAVRRSTALVCPWGQPRSGNARQSSEKARESKCEEIKRWSRGRPGLSECRMRVGGAPPA